MITKGMETQLKIVKSARETFLSKGFSGTSMSQIAAKAEVTKALLFHYFKNKEDLWKTVKESILKPILVDKAAHDTPIDSLEHFLEYVIGLRFNLYSNNPDLVLIMQWQRLELQNSEIQGTKSLPINIWLDTLTDFKNRNLISKSLDLDLLQDMIFSLSSLPFLENWEWIKNEKKVEDYKKMIIRVLLNLCE